MPTQIHVCILTTAHALDDKRVFDKIAMSLVKTGFRVSWVGPAKGGVDLNVRRKLGMSLQLSPELRSRMDRVLSKWRVVRVARRVDAVDVYYVPDPDAVPIALRLARTTNAKVIFDIHEVFHEVLLERHLRGFKIPLVKKAVRAWISSLCRRCSLVVGVSTAVLKHYTKPGDAVLVVRSCAPLWFADVQPAELGHDRPVFRVMHGLATLSRGTEALLRAVALIPPGNVEIKVVIFEVFIDAADKARFWQLVDELNVRSRIELRATVPLRDMPDILRTCDAGIVGYARDFGADSLPNRLFEYMAAGIPVVAPQYATEISAIVQGERCGMLVDVEQPQKIANALMYLMGDKNGRCDMGRRGRDGFVHRHNWENESKPMIRAICDWFPGRASIE